MATNLKGELAMNLNMIRGKISKAMKHENKNHTVADAIVRLGAQNGRRLTRTQTDEILTFIKEYIDHVPHFISEGRKQAKKNKVHEMGSILNAASWYWALEEDVIPDRIGLLGIIDDAYFSLCLLQGLSDHSLQMRGVALLPIDLKPANKNMRMLIGEPAATQLDMIVAEKLGTPNLMNAINALSSSAMAAGAMFATGPDPMWGNATMDEVVTARLGAMGVV
jgi:uncharacterized membrane protein YkvA (DUF1232 family)